MCIPIPYYSRIDRILDDTVDGGIRKILSVRLADFLFFQIPGKTLGTISLVHILLKNQLNDFRGIFVYRQIKDFFVSFIGTASFIQAIAIRNRSACIKAALCQLLQAGLSAYRSLDTLPRRLPIAKDGGVEAQSGRRPGPRPTGGIGGTVPPGRIDP